MRRFDLSREPAILAVKRPIWGDLEKVLGKDETPDSNSGLGSFHSSSRPAAFLPTIGDASSPRLFARPQRLDVLSGRVVENIDGPGFDQHCFGLRMAFLPTYPRSVTETTAAAVVSLGPGCYGAAGNCQRVESPAVERDSPARP